MWNERVEPGVRVAIRGEEVLMGESHCPEKMMSVIVVDGSGRVVVSMVRFVMEELKVILVRGEETIGGCEVELTQVRPCQR